MAQMTAKRIKKVETGHVLFVSGLLFEINRSVLHPVGLSLTWDEHEGIGMLDFSDMPDRAVFDQVDYSRGSTKLKNFMNDKGSATMKLRKQLLGFVTQSENSIGKNKNR